MNKNPWRDTEVPGIEQQDSFDPPLDQNEVALIVDGKIKRHWLQVTDPSDPMTQEMLRQGKHGIHVE